MPALRPQSAARVFAVLALAALALVFRVSPAAATPADSVQYSPLLSAHIEPPHPCATDSVWLVVADSCTACLLPIGYGPTNTDAARVTFRVGSEAACATPSCAVQNLRIPLGLRDPGSHFELVTFALEFPADSLHAAREAIFRELAGYEVSDSCLGPPPPPGPLPFVTHVLIGDTRDPCDSCPPHVCSLQPVSVHVSGLLPGSCYTFRGVHFLPTTTPPFDRPVVILDFLHDCAGPCSDLLIPFSTSFTLPAVLSGPHDFKLGEYVYACSDTGWRAVFSHVFPYVADSCEVTPPPGCVMPFLVPLPRLGELSDGCNLRLPPGGRGVQTFAVQAGDLALAGLQGSVQAGPGLHILGLTPVGPAAGMHLLTQASGPNSVSFVLFADSGAPIPGPFYDAVLAVAVKADSSLQNGTRSWVSGAVTAASNADGSSLPICAIETFAAVQAQVCIDSAGSCDANHDGVTNVADLVRMARCWLHPETCPDSLGSRPDCTGDGVFGVADIFCCARAILGGSPADSGHSAAGLSLSFGDPTLDQGVVHVALEIHGASAMNGALLRVRYPADRYAYLPGASPTLASGAAASAQWLPLTEAGDGDVVIGVLKLEDAAPDVVTVPLSFRVLDGQSAGGTLTADQGQVIAPDGSSLAIDLGRLTTSLPSGGPATVTRVELLCGPNPASGSTRFVVRLPQGAAVDLGVYDVAGRRVETLYKGSLAAGETPFTWQPRSAHGGIYFARLSVNGVVRTTRVTLQLAR